MNYLIARLSESGTYGAIAAMLAGFGVNLPPGIMQNVALLGMGAAGLAGVLLKEGPKAPQ